MSAAPARHGNDRGAGIDVLVVAPGFPANEQDDQCLPALQVFWKALPAFMPEATIRAVSLHYPFEPGPRAWQAIPVTDIGGRNRRWPLRLFALARAYRALEALTRQRRPDLIHVFFLRDAGLVASWFARRHGIPCVGTLVGQDSRPTNRYLRWQSDFARLIAESERAADLCVSNCGRRPVVIPWGVDAFEGDLPPRPARSIDLLGVGSLSPLKDFETFIRVSALLHTEGLVRRAVLIGDGPERGRLEALIEATGLHGVIECRGSISRAEVLDTMTDARILLHPSRYEGFGMVFAEARSRGMSIASRAVGCATASPWWSLCDLDAEFAQACRTQLGPDFEVPQGPGDSWVGLTVSRHATLYREVIAEHDSGTHAK